MPIRLAWIAGALAAAVAVLLRRRARGTAAIPTPDDDRASALRRKLDESKALVDEREEFEAAETPVDRAEPVAESVERRRRAVHEHGRTTAREMREAVTPRPETAPPASNPGTGS